MTTLGFMLPYTPLHHAAAASAIDRPLVMTSGNLSRASRRSPIVETRADQARRHRRRLRSMHDRDIANRVDDSVVRVVAGRAARWCAAPAATRRAPIRAAGGVRATRRTVLAFGGELKATFCLLNDGAAILSQHQGDLEDADDLRRLPRRTSRLYAAMFEHRAASPRGRPAPRVPVVQARRERARGRGRLPLDRGPASSRPHRRCMAENGVAARHAAGARRRARRSRIRRRRHALGRRVPARRLSRLPARSGRSSRSPCPAAPRPSASPGATPTRISMAAIGWQRLSPRSFAALDLFRFLEQKPLRDARSRCSRAASTPRSPAPAAGCSTRWRQPLGLCRERGAIRGPGGDGARGRGRRGALLEHEDDARRYPLASIADCRSAGCPTSSRSPMWQALLGDLRPRRRRRRVIAARFHQGLATAIVRMVGRRIARGSRGRRADRHRRAVGRLLPEPHPARAGRARRLEAQRLERAHARAACRPTTADSRSDRRRSRRARAARTDRSDQQKENASCVSAFPADIVEITDAGQQARARGRRRRQRRGEHRLHRR